MGVRVGPQPEPRRLKMTCHPGGRYRNGGYPELIREETVFSGDAGKNKTSVSECSGCYLCSSRVTKKNENKNKDY